MKTLTQQIEKLHELSDMLEFEVRSLNVLKSTRESIARFKVYEPSNVEKNTIRRIILFTYAIELLYIEMTKGKNEVAMNVLINSYDKFLMN